MTVVPLFAFLRFKTELFFNSFKVITSLRDNLFFGLVTIISASCVLTFSQSLSLAIEGWTGGIQLDLTWNGCVLCFVCERCFGGAFVLHIANCSKSCKSWCLISHSFVTGVGINLRPLIACRLDCQKFDSLRDIVGMSHLSPFLWLKAYILECVYALCVLCFLFCFHCC